VSSPLYTACIAHTRENSENKNTLTKTVSQQVLVTKCQSDLIKKWVENQSTIRKK
jgi:hypothetical protein